MQMFTVRRAEFSDLEAILAIQKVAFPDFQERRAVFEDRLEISGDGCLVVEENDEVKGYIISHPWHRGDPPALDTVLGALPEKPGCYYIHDLSLMPDLRGRGASGLLIQAAMRLAAGMALPVIGLMAVGGSSVFWRRHGFRPAGSAAARTMAAYGGDAVYMEYA